jgi:hypothetical protein
LRPKNDFRMKHFLFLFICFFGLILNTDALFNFKINSSLAASIQWTLIYDDDIDIRDAKGNVGPRTQFKSVMGITYKMEN